MFKTALTTVLLVTMLSVGKFPGVMFFSFLDRPVDKFRPKTESVIKVPKDNKIYFYIYSTKPFKTDYLAIRFIHVNNEGIIFPRTETYQTLRLDVDPAATCATGNINLNKPGQYIVKVLTDEQNDKILTQTEVWVE